jgi:hypothetical protein
MTDSFDQVPGVPSESEVSPPEENPIERVGRGLGIASVAIVAGIVLTVVIWRLGYVASISSFLLAAGATYAYTWAAGAAPRKGAVPLILFIVLGVIVGFLTMVASDALKAYDELGVLGVSKWSFVRQMVFNTEVLRSYAGDMLFYFGFAALGIFGTLRGLIGAQK